MPASYEIIIRGECSAEWREWFGNLTIERDAHGNTHLQGTLPDRAALLGILLRLQGLNLTLLRVESIERAADYFE